MLHKFDQTDFNTRKAAKLFLMQQHELATSITELQARMTEIEKALGIIHVGE